MAIHRQKIVFTSTRDYDLEDIEIRIPKVINTDVGFELMFGFEPDELPTDKRNHEKNYKFYGKDQDTGSAYGYSE